LKKALSAFGIAIFARSGIKLALDNFRWRKTIKGYKDIFRFSLACFLYSAIFKLVRKLFRFMKDKRIMIVTRNIEYFVAASLSVTGLFVCAKEDMNLFKTGIYSLSAVSCLHLLYERKWFNPIKGSCLCATTSSDSQSDDAGEKRLITVEGVATFISAVWIAYAWQYNS